jgi:hypothetical protein
MRRRQRPPQRRVALISCGKNKLEHAAPARQLYTGTQFRLALQVASCLFGEVLVLSAKYGLVGLEDVLEPYELSMRDVAPEEREPWGRNVVAALQARYPGELLELHAFASAPYVEPLRAALPFGWELVDPMQGLEQGYRLGYLSAWAEACERNVWPNGLEQPEWPEDGWNFHFSSGTNHWGEIRGLALSGLHVGITAHYLIRNTEMLQELSLYRGAPLRVFLDSGAYSEVEPGEEGLQTVRELGEPHWRMVLEAYARAVEALPGQVMVVAPDKVGDQVATLRRLKRYAAELRNLRQQGARIMVAIQRGDMSMADFDAEVSEVLGFDDFVRGIPASQKARFNLAELEAFVQALPLFSGAQMKVPALHLLGMGPRSPGFEATRAVVLRHLPGCEVTSDAVERRARVGRSNGPGGGPRSLTAAEDAVRAEWVLAGKGEPDAEMLKALATMRVFHTELEERKEQARARGWYDAELETCNQVA